MGDSPSYPLKPLGGSIPLYDIETVAMHEFGQWLVLLFKPLYVYIFNIHWNKEIIGIGRYKWINYIYP